jgi:hypothetical protein
LNGAAPVRQVKSFDSLDQRRRKFRVAYRTLFKFVEMNVLELMAG